MSGPSAGSIGRAMAGDDQPMASRRVGTVNPVTRLSTDYLNHFAEAIMILEMACAAPDCLDDLKAWQPRTYTEHFADSHFADRDVVIAAYRDTDPAIRAALDAVSQELNSTLAETCHAVLHDDDGARTGAVVKRAMGRLKPLIATAAAIINGTAMKEAGNKGAQATVDALFAR